MILIQSKVVHLAPEPVYEHGVYSHEDQTKTQLQSRIYRLFYTHMGYYHGYDIDSKQSCPSCTYVVPFLVSEQSPCKLASLVDICQGDIAISKIHFEWNRFPRLTIANKANDVDSHI